MSDGWKRAARFAATASVIGGAILTGLVAGGREAGRSGLSAAASPDASAGVRPVAAPSAGRIASGPVADEPVVRTVTPVVTPPLTSLPSTPALPRPPVEAKDVAEPGIPAFPAVRDPVHQ